MKKNSSNPARKSPCSRRETKGPVNFYIVVPVDVDDKKKTARSDNRFTRFIGDYLSDIQLNFRWPTIFRRNRVGYCNLGGNRFIEIDVKGS